MSDIIATAVAADLAQRAAVGLRKYGVGLADADLTNKKTLQHAYEEALDLASYLKRVLMATGETEQPPGESAKKFGCHVDRALSGNADAAIYADCVIDKGEARTCTFATCGDKAKCRHWHEVAK